QFIDHLIQIKYADIDPRLGAIGYELEALLSIYSPGNIRLSAASRPNTPPTPNQIPLPPPIPSSHSPTKTPMRHAWDEAVFDSEFGLTSGQRIRYEIHLPLWDEGDAPENLNDLVAPLMRILVSLPPTYPMTSPPQLQLLGRYLGSFPIDSAFFGLVTRTYLSSTGVTFEPGDVCVFEGLTHVQSLARKWYLDHLSSIASAETERQRQRDHQISSTIESSPAIHDITQSSIKSDNVTSAKIDKHLRPLPRTIFSYTHKTSTGVKTPDAVNKMKNAMELGQEVTTGLEIFTSESITDRKSVFVGHAVKVTDEREVPLVIHELLSDRKIAKATHPCIFAYRISKDVGGLAGKVVIAVDNHDDGENGAGSRLAHLLDMLEVENVLVVVTRWYGGILLGADRFKRINQVAKDALKLAGVLDE
ncbi:hypothetical protein TREMEDRAFT_31804, partial [Tremella mesenterica DSM 1558]|uniref:uncharacterized protein n=1 Tax=Tremella mesenterica (strain ATCC 24925 / CBS 8224 / DSM 1558 / NBRC 9311 / NRRL Y-6157 / RJB 2259-6 / UBC 559-6) TaxID=578456 RepID=UPI0003F4A287